MNISKFKHFVKCRNQSGNRSSGGLSVYVNQKLAKGVSYIPSEKKNNMVRCKLDKSYFNFQNDIYRGTVYLSPPNYGRNNSEDLIREEDLIRRRNVFIFTKGWHIVQGDYNARTGDIQEQSWMIITFSWMSLRTMRMAKTVTRFRYSER